MAENGRGGRGGRSSSSGQDDCKAAAIFVVQPRRTADRRQAAADRFAWQL